MGNGLTPTLGDQGPRLGVCVAHLSKVERVGVASLFLQFRNHTVWCLVTNSCFFQSRSSLSSYYVFFSFGHLQYLTHKGYH